MATVSYGLKIINANRIFDTTLRIYRAAVSYLMDIADRHYEELLPITGYVNARGKKVTAQQARQQYLERLVHATKDRPDVPYKNFDKNFYKFPSYLRRDAINTAIGNIMSYRSQVKNWEDGGCRGKKPFFVHNRSEMPCFYHYNTFFQDGTTVSLKLYDGHDWVWKTASVRQSDWNYVQKYMIGWASSAPVLSKRGHRYELRVAYTIANTAFPKFKKDKYVISVIGVDLGVNTDAVCAAVQDDGTVTGQRFINSPVEKDRMYGLLNTIKKAQQNGNYKTPRLWRLVDYYNMAVSIHAATEIIRFAKECGASVIVFEHLDIKGKKRGSKKQRLQMWRKRDIQKRVTEMAKRNGIRVSYICARNTSRLAYDGSGKVLRGRDTGFTTYELCRFKSGKIYNCDLSAAKNIAARYYIRVILKSVSAKELLLLQAKVPDVSRRTSCTLATLINLDTELTTPKAV